MHLTRLISFGFVTSDVGCLNYAITTCSILSTVQILIPFTSLLSSLIHARHSVMSIVSTRKAAQRADKMCFNVRQLHVFFRSNLIFNVHIWYLAFFFATLALTAFRRGISKWLSSYWSSLGCPDDMIFQCTSFVHFGAGLKMSRTKSTSKVQTRQVENASTELSRLIIDSSAFDWDINCDFARLLETEVVEHVEKSSSKSARRETKCEGYPGNPQSRSTQHNKKVDLQYKKRIQFEIIKYLSSQVVSLLLHCSDKF